MSRHFDKDLPQIYRNKLTFTNIADGSNLLHFIDAKEFQTWKVEQEQYVAEVGDQSAYDPANYRIV